MNQVSVLGVGSEEKPARNADSIAKQARVSVLGTQVCLPQCYCTKEDPSMALLTDSLVTQMLQERYIASLATQNPNGSIHMVAVWYFFDGAHVYVATSARSRKARNLQSKSNVSVMIDSRDVAASRGSNIVGTAEIVTGDSSRQWNAQIHRKYLSEAALADPRVGRVFAAVDDVTVMNPSWTQVRVTKLSHLVI